MSLPANPLWLATTTTTTTEVGDFDSFIHAEQLVVAFDVPVYDVVFVQMAQGYGEEDCGG